MERSQFRVESQKSREKYTKPDLDSILGPHSHVVHKVQFMFLCLLYPTSAPVASIVKVLLKSYQSAQG